MPLFILFCVTFVPQQSVYQEGMEIMKTQGVDAGLAYFKGKPTTYESLFGTGWIFFKKGEYDKAMKVSRFLMDQEITPKVEANTHFLMGYIHIHGGSFTESESHFQQAYQGYEALGLIKDSFKTLLGLAKSQLHLNLLKETEITLAKAWKKREDLTVHLGHYFQLRAELAFEKNDFHGALAFAEDGLSEFQLAQDSTNTAIAMIEVAFYTSRTGQYKLGMQKAEQAQKFIVDNGLNALSYNNALNYLYNKRCNRLPYDEDLEALREHIKQSNDDYLNKMLKYVQECECP